MIPTPEDDETFDATDEKIRNIREWLGFDKPLTPGTPPAPPSDHAQSVPDAHATITCWLCGRRSPRLPATDWLAVLHRCDGKHQLFHCCSKACHQMASVLLVGIASLLQRQ